MIFGTGVDIVEVFRMKDAIEKWGENFLSKIFTEREIHYSNSKRFSSQHFAARFAAKEAVLKLLGTGWRGKIAWTDIEIINNSLGRPQVTLSGEVKKIASKLGVGEISLSISHTANFVMASATALTDEK